MKMRVQTMIKCGARSHLVRFDGDLETFTAMVRAVVPATRLANHAASCGRPEIGFLYLSIPQNRAGAPRAFAIFLAGFASNGQQLVDIFVDATSTPRRDFAGALPISSDHKFAARIPSPSGDGGIAALRLTKGREICTKQLWPQGTPGGETRLQKGLSTCRERLPEHPGSGCCKPASKLDIDDPGWNPGEMSRKAACFSWRSFTYSSVFAARFPQGRRGGRHSPRPITARPNPIVGQGGGFAKD
jgi:hypothetical protein